jgi:hypothetical protein
VVATLRTIDLVLLGAPASGMEMSSNVVGIRCVLLQVVNTTVSEREQGTGLALLMHAAESDPHLMNCFRTGPRMDVLPGHPHPVELSNSVGNAK